MSEQGFHPEQLGTWSEETEFFVPTERTVAYALATNDPLEKHLDGSLAPPVFAIVPAFDLLADSTLQAVPDDLMLKILHGEQDFYFHRPLVPGETVFTRSKVVGIHGKASGVVITTVSETRDQAGELVNEQYFSGFFRDGELPEDLGELAPTHDLEDAVRNSTPAFTVSQRFDADQTFRYSGPAGDPMPIHLDNDVAKAAGLPGIIIHGLCTMAFTSHALLNELAPEDPGRLKRLAVRFSSPAFPEQEMVSTFWRGPSDSSSRTTYHFESIGTGGKTLISNGLAELENLETSNKESTENV